MVPVGTSWRWGVTGGEEGGGVGDGVLHQGTWRLTQIRPTQTDGPPPIGCHCQQEPHRPREK